MSVNALHFGIEKTSAEHFFSSNSDESGKKKLSSLPDKKFKGVNSFRYFGIMLLLQS